MKGIPFTEVREYLEARGWRFQRIWRPYRVFLRGDNELPIMVEVEEGMVDRRAFEEIKKHAE
jgi:hypothetical protein